MRPKAYLDFVRDRVIEEWVTNRTPDGPLLEEPRGRPPRVCSKPGHEGRMVKRADVGSRCLECARERQQRKREGKR